jgi:hypothetical protein
MLSDSMSPYVECKVGREKQRTAVSKIGGVNPAWQDEMMLFDLTGDDDTLRVKVFNKNMLSDDVIGVARVPLNYLILMSGHPSSGDAARDNDRIPVDEQGDVVVNDGTTKNSDVDGDGVDEKENADAREAEEQLRAIVAGNSKMTEAKRATMLAMLDCSEEELPADEERMLSRRDAWFGLLKDSKESGHVMLGFDFIPADGSGTASFLPVDDECSEQLHSLSTQPSDNTEGSKSSVVNATAAAAEAAATVTSGGGKKKKNKKERKRAAAAATPSISGGSSSGGSGGDDADTLALGTAETLFGTSLDEGVRRSAHDVPLVVFDTVAVIAASRHLENLLSTPGDDGAVNFLQRAYEANETQAFAAPSTDVGDAVALLSLYLLSLQQPPIPTKAKSTLLKVAGEKDASKRMKALTKATAALPPETRALVAHCVWLGKQLVASFAESKQDLPQVCAFFTPLLFHTSKDVTVGDSKLLAGVVKEWIEAGQVIMKEELSKVTDEFAKLALASN